jgi:hypothetical protein
MADTLPRSDSAETMAATPNVFSPTATAVDLSSAGNVVAKPESTSPSTTKPTLAQTLTQTRKWSLLAMFSLAFFIDIWSYSAFFVFTGPISEDLDVPFAQSSWVITSYAVTFSSFLLLWGRVSDLYSAKPVFGESML